jgi:hypothetical protein
MKLCIITDNKMVAKDGKGYSGLDISAVPGTVHALQWYETYGEIEYKSTGPYKKPANEVITSLPDWANTAIAKWEEAQTAEDIAIEAARIEAARIAAQNQPTSQGLQQA